MSAGWTPRFVPIIQRKPVIQAKPKLVPRTTTTTTITTAVSSSSSSSSTSPPPPPLLSSPSTQNNTTTSTTSVTLALTEPVATEEEVNSVVTKQNTTSDVYNEYKTVSNVMRNQRSLFDKRKPGKGAKKQLPPLSLDDDYDPTRPNDYEEYKEMEKRRKEDETVSRHQDNLKKRQRSISSNSDHRRRSSPYSHQSSSKLLYSNSSSPSHSHSSKNSDENIAQSPQPIKATVQPPTTKLDLDISGEEAFLRRAKLSNRSNIVNEPISKSPEIKPTNTSSSGEDFAHRLLAKYGWQEGQGLGKNEQGINVPLTVKKTDARSGIIMNNSSNINNTVQVGNELIQKAIQNIEIPSRVILLTNMVGPGQVDDTLQEETADECNEKYGTVERCLIFEVPNGKLPDHEAVRIFVKFVEKEAAMKAKKDLNGRFFGGRMVTAKFFDEARFDKLDLAPTSTELLGGE